MKTLISLLLFISFSIADLSAGIVPEVLICSEDVKVVTYESPDFFKSAVYNLDSEVIAFTTTSDISVLQIYDDEGNMNFQLPVMSNNVLINKNLFKKGNYKLGFLVEGNNQIYFSSIIIK